MSVYDPKIGDVIRWVNDPDDGDAHLIVSDVDVDEYDNPSVLTVDLTDMTASRFYRPAEQGVKLREATYDELRLVVRMLSQNAWEQSPSDWNQLRLAVNAWTTERLRGGTIQEASGSDGDRPHA